MLLVGDIGRTTCRLAAFEPDRRGVQVEVACGASLADHGGVSAIVAAIEDGLSTLGALDGLTGVGIGVTGAAQSDPATTELAAALERRLAAPVTVTSDVVTAHSGAFEGGPGVLTVAGTGAVALAVTPDATATMVDGWGHLLGDAGSGAAIGRAGLAAALRAHDGRPGGSDALAQAARVQLGDLDQLARTVQGAPHPVRLMAGFARSVADCARAGDPAATRIWRRAARDLADTTLTACRTMPADGPLSVALAGALFELEDLVAGPVRAAVAAAHPGADLRVPAGDALDGAYRLVTDAEGLHHDLLLRTVVPDRSRSGVGPEGD